MTPEEKQIVKVLVAVAWVDGKMDDPESGVIEGLLADFDASPEDEKEIRGFAKTPRTLRDADVSGLSAEHRDTLLRNAALLVCADGVETEAEQRLIAQLAKVLEVNEKDTNEVVRSVRDSLPGAHRDE
jgi:uncharacterized tellurite resistance protein B-like protein